MYGLRDVGEAAVGAFSSVLFFFAVRQGEPLRLKPVLGAIIGFGWILLIFMANFNRRRSRESLTHFIGDLLTVVLLTFILSVAFDMGDASIFGLEYFGSAAWVAVWVGLPVAILFDMNNFTNVLSRYYVRRGRK